MSESRSVVVDGLRLGYLEQGCGKAAEAPILLLHGLVASAETFGKLMAELPAERRIVALDLLAAEPLGMEDELDVSFDGLAKIIRGFCAAIELDRPVLLGHSHGGVLALQIAAAEPEFADALILLCPAHPFSRHEDGLVRFYLSTVGRCFARVIPFLPRRLQLVGFRRMAGPESRVSPQQFEPYRKCLRRPGATLRLLRLLRTWQSDMAALGARMSAHPVRLAILLLWGENDLAVPLKTAPLLQEHLVDSQLIVLPGKGHMLSEEAPRECAGLIGAWLLRQKEGRA